ncbi:hypothetical protein ACFLZ2_02450 [Candidatus Margulisiibacteriota bacterium]
MGAGLVCEVGIKGRAPLKTRTFKGHLQLDVKNMFCLVSGQRNIKNTAASVALSNSHTAFVPTIGHEALLSHHEMLDARPAVVKVAALRTKGRVADYRMTIETFGSPISWKTISRFEPVKGYSAPTFMARHLKRYSGTLVALDRSPLFMLWPEGNGYPGDIQVPSYGATGPRDMFHGRFVEISIAALPEGNFRFGIETVGLGMHPKINASLTQTLKDLLEDRKPVVRT